MAKTKLSADSKDFIEQMNLAEQAVSRLVNSIKQLNSELQTTNTLVQINGKEIYSAIEKCKNLVE